MSKPHSQLPAVINDHGRVTEAILVFVSQIHYSNVPGDHDPE